MEINYEKYHHLSFDLWLTLIQSHPEFKGKRNQLFKDFFEAKQFPGEITYRVLYEWNQAILKDYAFRII